LDLYYLCEKVDHAASSERGGGKNFTLETQREARGRLNIVEVNNVCVLMKTSLRHNITTLIMMISVTVGRLLRDENWGWLQTW
jgi:N-acyl-L-homoserine lactone synthetase